MAMYFDRVARTFVVESVRPSEGVTVRTHTQSPPSEQLRNNRQRMRAGARELLNVISRAPGKRWTFEEIRAELPQVNSSTLHVRLSSLTAREDIDRWGTKGHYRYSLPEGSTFRST